MIISVARLKEKYPSEDTESLTEKINAIEWAIRGYTNNEFQDKRLRFKAKITNGILYPKPSYIKVGDTITITQGLNHGFYTVDTICDEHFTVENYVIDEEESLVTKVYYPPDVISVAFDLMEWQIKHSEKVIAGVSSEQISRYSVSYGNMDFDNTNINGYPSPMMKRLKPYMKAKF